MARLYAKVVGASVVLIGVAGPFLGDRSLAGVLNIDLAEDVIHLGSGFVLLYAGFVLEDATTKALEALR